MKRWVVIWLVCVVGFGVGAGIGIYKDRNKSPTVTYLDDGSVLIDRLGPGESVELEIIIPTLPLLPPDMAWDCEPEAVNEQDV